MDIVLAIRGERVVTPEGTRPAAVLVESGGRIAAVAPPDAVPAGCQVFDAGRAAVLPGLVDTHVHVNEPGRTEWEGFATATRAAAAGGVTTIVDMPLNSSPVTTTAAALAAKIAAARGKLHVDCGFWGGLVPGGAGDLEALAGAGALGVKAFLCPSGIDDFLPATEADLRAGMAVLARLGLPLLAHAEIVAPVPEAAARLAREPRSHAAWLATRPRAFEHEAIGLLIALARETGCDTHVVHLASADALPMLRRAIGRLVPITVETCPHYLFFAAEEVPEGGTAFKCAPPIREAENRERLWEGIRDGTISIVATDHSPAPPALKQLETGDFGRAWGGIASLQLGLAAFFTGAVERGLGLDDVADLMSFRPAELAGLEGRKGSIAPGMDADLVLFDDQASFVVEAALLEHRHKVTPYSGRTLRGVVERTFLRGVEVYRRGRPFGAPRGRIMLRDAGGAVRTE
jgi:allantoinase